MPHGVAKIENRAVYRLRALEMLEHRIHGAGYAEIAETFGCSIDTVARSLKWAAREGVVEEYEQKLLGKLVPKALEVYREKLDEGDVFVAKDIVDKLIKLGDRYSSQKQHTEEMGLQAYIATKRSKQAEKSVEGSVIDADTIETGGESLEAGSLDEGDFDQMAGDE